MVSWHIINESIILFLSTWVLKCQLLKVDFRKWFVDYYPLIELKLNKARTILHNKVFCVKWNSHNSCWQIFSTLQCAQPQVPCQVKTALGSFGGYCAVCLLVRGVFLAKGSGTWHHWGIPDLCIRRVLSQHWLHSTPVPQKEHQELLRVCSAPLQSLPVCLGLLWAGRWSCCSERRQLRGHCRTAAAGTKPQPCLLLQSSGREGVQKGQSHRSSAVLNHRQGNLHHIPLKNHFY